MLRCDCWKNKALIEKTQDGFLVNDVGIFFISISYLFEYFFF